MIETAETTTTNCLACGEPIIQIGGRGHRQRLYCNDICRQRAHRKRQEPQDTASVTNDVTNGDLQQRIAHLEQELTQYRKIADLLGRAKIEARFMDLGKQVEYHTLTTFNILGGFGYWQDFMKRAKDEDLLKAIAAAEYYLEGLIALRGDPQQRRITELEREKKDLQARLDFEERFLTDTKAREFKIWLRSHPQPRGTNFFQRFLDDRDLPTKASRSLYEAKLQHSKNYDEIDILLFKDAWRRMLFNQT